MQSKYSTKLQLLLHNSSDPAHLIKRAHRKATLYRVPVHPTNRLPVLPLSRITVSPAKRLLRADQSGSRSAGSDTYPGPPGPSPIPVQPTPPVTSSRPVGPIIKPATPHLSNPLEPLELRRRPPRRPFRRRRTSPHGTKPTALRRRPTPPPEKTLHPAATAGGECAGRSSSRSRFGHLPVPRPPTPAKPRSLGPKPSHPSPPGSSWTPSNTHDRHNFGKGGTGRCPNEHGRTRSAQSTAQPPKAAGHSLATPIWQPLGRQDPFEGPVTPHQDGRDKPRELI